MRKATMTRTKNPIAILVSDIHLSHHAPRYRRAEPDWYEAMARHLRSLKRWQEELAVPVICAGDVFHHWNSPPKLINFAIEMLPRQFISIPGQHDLPHHRLEAVKDSAYWTLMESRDKLLARTYAVHLFPWGTTAEDSEVPTSRPAIALLHRYVCSSENAFPGAPLKSFVSEVQKEFWHYDLIISVSYTHLKMPTTLHECRSRWSPYH